MVKDLQLPCGVVHFETHENQLSLPDVFSVFQIQPTPDALFSLRFRSDPFQMRMLLPF